MVKCPFCHYDNEEGALFCEQCKSDLAGVEPAVAAQPVAAEVPVATAEIIETVPLVSVPEGVPIIEAAVVESAVAEGVPVVESVPIEAVPIQAVETVPLASQVTAPPAPPPASAPAAAPAPAPLPPDAQPRLLVLRGLKRNVEYPLYEGHNFIGRADEKPVDIDLDDQEAPDRVWSSRQHALITFEEGKLVIEDLNSANGTFVNRARIYPGQKRDLAVGDVVHIGTVQMKVIV